MPASAIPLPELEQLAESAIEDRGRALLPAELHGAVVGIAVCEDGSFNLQVLLDLLGADALADEPSVVAFVSAACDSLMAEDLSFALLLPEDDAAAGDRLTALAGWAQSFVAGFAAGLAARNVDSLEELPSEVQEIVRDMVAISNLDEGEEDEDGDLDADFAELEEYLKVGVLLIFSLINDVADDTAQ